ncbi:divergent polysaccharide deacetylase family protein [Paenibacillus glufosinatiresistens]|uniref:divergent polysaccharide deacetylase family protein n=1 Tax=Paenibacillus glufosinatiresistens TaxID=3070657 RepID=UPI00286D8241|nr:divergent polysaccharide deacetylase family protein [Paenibacillus sp. YX.27]
MTSRDEGRGRGLRLGAKWTAALLLAAAVMGMGPAAYALGPADRAGVSQESTVELASAAAAAPGRDQAKPDSTPVPGEKRPAPSRMAIIIDDLGNGMKGTDEMFELPVKLTVAVMPFLPTTQADAARAHKRGDDVLLHLPMEPRQGKPEWLGPGAVLARMSDGEVRKRVEAALDDVPYAIGINNHMGSKVTGDERVMRIILDVCRERGLFFVDSKTNYRSVVGRMALEMGLPKVENQIFLDDIHTAGHVSKQMSLAGKMARDNRFCITIGHVGVQGRQTAAGIRTGYESLKNQVVFVGISDLLREEWHWTPKPLLP